MSYVMPLLYGASITAEHYSTLALATSFYNEPNKINISRFLFVIFSTGILLDRFCTLYLRNPNHPALKEREEFLRRFQVGFRLLQMTVYRHQARLIVFLPFLAAAVLSYVRVNLELQRCLRPSRNLTIAVALALIVEIGAQVGATNYAFKGNERRLMVITSLSIFAIGIGVLFWKRFAKTTPQRPHAHAV